MAANNKLVTDNPTLHYGNSTTYMQLSGSSVASGVVAGAVAVLVGARPWLTPGLVKAAGGKIAKKG